MAYIKACLFLAAVVACALAAEEPVREKKAVYLGSGVYAAHDDGQWAPGKYEGVSAYAYPYAAVPAAVPAVHAAIPAAYPYAHTGFRSVVY